MSALVAGIPTSHEAHLLTPLRVLDAQVASAQQRYRERQAQRPTLVQRLLRRSDSSAAKRAGMVPAA